MMALLQETTTQAWLGLSPTFGAWAGSAVGILGALVGTAAGVLAPRGKGRGLVLGSLTLMSWGGVLALLFGLAALFAGQPYHVWYTFLLLGAILGGCGFGVGAALRRVYRQVEARRLEAEALRRS